MRWRAAIAMLGCVVAGTQAGSQTRTGVISVGDATLRYELAGRGETVVFVHGWANTLAIWDDQVAEFSKRYQVLRWDRRGFGRSTGDADLSADPDDLRILMDSLRITSAYVVGLSAGSEVATRFAFRFPERTRALVRLSGPPPQDMPGTTSDPDTARAVLANIARTHGMDSLHKFVLRQVGYVPADETEAERKKRLARQQTWDYSGRDLLDPRPQSGRVPPVTWARIRELTVPTLLVNGDHDNARGIMVADSLARYLPNARRVVIPRAGHAANVGASGRFNAVVLEFLASLPSRQARKGMLNVGSTTLRFEDVGSGRPIVFIHGWAQDLSIWDDQMAAFSPSYRVIRYDKRGFGHSTGHADITEDPNDLRILLDSLGVRTAHIVGLSRGARVALSFAVAFPNRVDRLVLYGLSPPEGFQPAPPMPGPVALFAEVARKHGLDSMAKVVLGSPLVWLPPDEAVKARVVRIIQAGFANYMGRDLLDPRPPSGRVPLARVNQLDGVKARTLVILGDHDLPLNHAVADTVVRRIPNARKVVLPNAGHGAHLYDPKRFNDALLALFAGRS